MTKTKNDWWRVTFDHEGTRRALFGLGRSSLGGLIIDIGAYKPFGKWRCGVFDLPGGGAEQVATLDVLTLQTPVLAPKFHYHPNGHFSINHHGHVERRAIDGPPMDDLHGDHVLTLHVRRPETFPEKPPKACDLGVTATAPTPVVKFVVYIHQESELDPLVRSIPSAGFAVPPENNDSGKVLLVFKFPPYAAVLKVVDNPPEFTDSDGPPTIFGTGFDRRVITDPTVPTKILVVQPHEDDALAPH